VTMGGRRKRRGAGLVEEARSGQGAGRLLARPGEVAA